MGHLTEQDREELWEDFDGSYVSLCDLTERIVARHRAEAKAEALREARDAYDTEGLLLKPGAWGSNPIDQALADFAVATKGWLGDRADRIEKEQDQ